ncbi:MAG: hypothetical protein KDC92_12185, partial [Bacteroidetes bacterium]|nr:hypothetical protein [Bacteroidota bacterium]
MNQNLILLLTSCASFLFSCQSLFEEVPENNAKSLFEQTWNFTNEEYSFFEMKGVDWDSVYNYTEPKITNDMNEH